MEFNFPNKLGIGISKFIPHVSADCQDIILKLLAYNPDDRLSTKQALSHKYFKDLQQQEEKLNKMSTLSR